MTDDATDSAPAETSGINLKILSPSLSVAKPLLFPNIAPTTTIRQLKEKIRNELPLRPTDENQRLIHRGKALLRETDTLEFILGAEAVQSPEVQTIHLVVREPAEQAPSSSTLPAAAPVQQGTVLQNLFRQTAPAPAADTTASQRPAVPSVLGQGQMPSPAPAPFPDQAARTIQDQHQNLSNWLANVQREARARAIINQGQRGRAYMGMRGVGDAGLRSDSPAPSHTIYRETIAPSGHTFQIETRTGPITRPTHMDALNALGSTMQRSASGASMSGRSLAQPGVTVPAFNMPGSGRATPDPLARTSLSTYSATSLPMVGATRPTFEVYILQSPDGPQAILMNTQTTESYTSARDFSPIRLPGRTIRPASHPAPTPTVPPPAYQQPAPQAMGQPPAQQPPNPQVEPIQPLHVNAAAPNVAGLMGQMVPHFWSAVRLGFFVWLITNKYTTWTRFIFTIIIAIFIFILNTGALNGYGENIWRPLIQRLETIFPAAGRPANAPNADPAVATAADATRIGPEGLQPGDMAARLVAERQNRESWASVQLRRVERGGLLFLASIAPGIAERHIARVEAEARAEEQRQREAQAAAEATAEAARAAAEAEAESGEKEKTTDIQETEPLLHEEPTNGTQAREVSAT